MFMDWQLVLAQFSICFLMLEETLIAVLHCGLQTVGFNMVARNVPLNCGVSMEISCRSDVFA